MNKWVQRLLIANVLMYFVQQTVAGTTEALLFVPSGMFIHPWTLITYTFVHASLMHIGFNLVTTLSVL